MSDVADSVRTASTELVAAYLAEQVLGGSSRPRMWLFPGYDSDLVEHLVKLLWTKDVEIKVDQYYRENTMLPDEAFLDLSRESFTQYRNLRQKTTVLMPRNAHGPEWESLDAIETIDQEDLRSRIDDFIELLPGAARLFGSELDGLSKVMSRMVRIVHPTLQETLRYLLRTQRLREEGIPTKEALGKALPELGAFSYQDAFRGVSLTEPRAKQLDSIIRRAIVRSRDYVQKIAPTGEPLSPEELQANLMATQETIPEGSAQLLERFIAASARDEEARDDVIELDWQKDCVHLVFERPRKVSKGLGEKTRTHLEQSSGTFVTQADNDLLRQMDDWKSLTEESRDRLEEFYVRSQVHLETDNRLNERWRRLLYRQDVQDLDFLAALVKVADELIDGDNLRSEDFPLRLRLNVELQTVGEVLDNYNCDAVMYFVTRYHGLDELLGSNVELDFRTLPQVASYVEARERRQEVPHNIEADLDAFVKEARATKKANQLFFKAQLIRADGTVVEGLSKRFLWKFNNQSFLSGFARDMRRHSKHPLRRYLLPRALSSRKGIKPPVALDEPECVDRTGDRGYGEVTSDLLEGSARDVRQEVERGLDLLVRDNFFTHNDAVEVRRLLDRLHTLLTEAFTGFFERGLAWRNWENFGDDYADALKRLAEIGHGGRYAELILSPVTAAGTAIIEGEQGTAIVPPTHPLRLLSLFVKAQQVSTALARWFAHPDVEYIDHELYIRELVRDLRHPYYPEVITDGGRTLLAHSATLGDYSLFTKPEEQLRSDGNSRNDDPREAAKVLIGVVRDFLNLHPHERHNLSILQHSIASARFPQVLTDQLRASSDESLASVHSALFLRDSDMERLRSTYRSYLSNIEPDGTSEVDMPFLSQLSVTALSQASTVRLGNGDVDIAFLLDQVAGQATVNWQDASSDIPRPSLLSHYPARWGRRRAYDPADNFSASYLCCPVNPDSVDAFYRLVKHASAHAGTGDTDSVPVHQIDYGDFNVRETQEEAHRLAAWVVNYDAVIDQRQLRRMGVDVIRYRPSIEENRNLIVSSKQPGYVVRDHIRRRLESAGLLTNGVSPALAVNRVWEAANTLSGGLILRAAGRGYFVNELLGAVLSQKLLSTMLEPELARHAIWVYLDEYSSWFRHATRSTGDLSQPDGKALADLLCIVPERISEGLVLHVLLSEAKVIERGSSLTQAAQRSKSQLLATYDRLKDIIGPKPAEDKDFWQLRLGNLIVQAGQRWEAAGLDPEEIRAFIREGHVAFRLEGHSHIFTADGTVEPAKLSMAPTEEAYQWILPQNTFRQIFDSFVASDANLDVDKLVSQSPAGTNVINVTPPIVTPPTHDGAPTNDQGAAEDAGPTSVIQEGAPEAAEEEEPREPIRESSSASEEAKRLFPWSVPYVADFLASVQPITTSEEEGADLQQQLQDVEAAVKRFFPAYDFRTELGESVATPNSFRIRIRGQHKLTVAKIEALRDELLTIEGLRLINVEAEPGYLALSFLRPQRSSVLYLDCLKERTVTAEGANTSVLLGRREDNGELLYYDFNQADAHALIGGMSNSGKSRLLVLVILDLALTNNPNSLKLILVDPKQVEFNKFRRLPHLHGGPIVGTKEEAKRVLNDLILEMDRRYQLMGQKEVNSIRRYNSLPGVDLLPRIVLVFDEFADWMLDDDFKRSVNDTFKRLAGKARAAGIHLVLSTQRPDNTVVSPILRANLGAKIALRVDKRANSEIILDEDGAERLLGSGQGIARLASDRCLFQTAFIADEFEELVLNSIGNLYPSFGKAGEA